MPTFRQIWGARIKAARLDAGLTHRQISQALNVDQSLIYKWETGLVAPRDDTRHALADILGVDVDVLFRYANGDDDHTPAGAR